MNNDHIIKQFDTLPDGILEVLPENLHTLVPEPTLFHLSGKRSDTLFVSVMLHGNEPVGLQAVQRLLKKYQQQPLPRALTLFFGNTQAAKHNVRHLDNQPDFNRIWPGTCLPESLETRWTKEIVTLMRQRSLFASVDIHNNTGLNPHYACINKLDNEFLHLGMLFGRLLVYFTQPKGVQTSAFAEFCPAVTLECGRPGQQHGAEHAFEFLDSSLHLTEIASHPIVKHDIDLYHTVAQVTIADGTVFSFSDALADLYLNEDLERMNFTEIPAGTAFGSVANGKIPVIAKDNAGQPITEQFFALDGQQLIVNRATMPSMLTLNEKVIRQDCFCYLMERIQL